VNIALKLPTIERDRKKRRLLLWNNKKLLLLEYVALDVRARSSGPIFRWGNSILAFERRLHVAPKPREGDPRRIEQNGALIAEVCRAAALSASRVAVTAATTTPKSFSGQMQNGIGKGGSLNNWKRFLQIGASLSKRDIGTAGYERERQW
jgi:hypothetical protein